MLWSVETLLQNTCLPPGLIRPKLVLALLVHKCSCGIVIAIADDAEKVEWVVTYSTWCLDMTTPDDRSIASLAEVFSAWARSGRLISR